ncbi:MAG TPA: hypothetical protein VHR46_06420 [Gaiella sp.]|jgi:hypothetical protein|nr:hypothetical protein [Gaiella sp.]
MSGGRHEVESEIVLPDGMELVVPPRPKDENEPLKRSGVRRESGRSGHARPVHRPPLVHRGGPRRAPDV